MATLLFRYTNGFTGGFNFTVCTCNSQSNHIILSVTTCCIKPAVIKCQRLPTVSSISYTSHFYKANTNCSNRITDLLNIRCKKFVKLLKPFYSEMYTHTHTHTHTHTLDDVKCQW